MLHYARHRAVTRLHRTNVSSSKNEAPVPVGRRLARFDTLSSDRAATGRVSLLIVYGTPSRLFVFLSVALTVHQVVFDAAHDDASLFVNFYVFHVPGAD